MKRAFLSTLIIGQGLLLSACFTTAQDLSGDAPTAPQAWSAYQSDTVDVLDAQGGAESLKGWWKRFDDPTLDALIEMALAGNPDRKIAQARIAEARGIARTATGGLFPQVGLSGQKGRSDSGSGAADNFYDAGFDASFELDLFGGNRAASRAADAGTQAAEANYDHASLSLIAEVGRSYIEYRSAEKQTRIALKNLEIQDRTLGLIRNQRTSGEATQLDTERAENLVNTTRSSIPEYQRQGDQARLRLAVLTGNMPDGVVALLETQADIPGADLRPVLMAPASVIAQRPDIRAAAAMLAASTDNVTAANAEIFPSVNVSGLYGIANSALINTASVWSIAIGAAVNLIDFGRIRGRIDTAEARQIQSFETYRKTILEAVSEVEGALADYARINESRQSLVKASGNAQRALNLSRQLFDEGEVSFLDVLDAQRTVNQAESDLISAESAQSQSLIRLYKALGVY